MSDLVTFGIDRGVGVITLNSPDSLNALSDDMHVALNRAFVDAYRSEDARVIVLTGAGRAFCAGADLARLTALIETRGASYDIPRPGSQPVVAFAGIDAPPELLTTYTFPLAMNKPVIAAVNGPCVGVGFVLAACCDVRFLSDRAFFDSAFPQRGLVAEFGLAWLLPRLVGHGAASDILLSGRRVRADEARQLGLANRVVPGDDLLDTALDYARAMAASAAPSSLRVIRQQLWRAHHQSYGDATAEAWDLLMTALAGDDFIEGVNSFLEKRPANFTGR
jgi:enoyl-CoA hydratase/carnithine racemase